MKSLLLFFAFLILTGCFSHASSVSDAGKPIQPKPTVENSNSNKGQYSYSDYKYEQDLIDKLNAENEQFRQIPNEFKSVDFMNFKYNFGRLKNGEYEDGEPNNPLAGRQTFSFGDVFYIDLTGDAKKEAVVFLYNVRCGASCDGGRDLVYFYSSNIGKAKLIDILETGSNSGGCSLKSFTIKNKKFYIEQFGRCINDTTFEMNSTSPCKFCAKDETHSVYLINGDGLKRESVEIFETETINLMNSPSFISINE